MLSLFSPQLLNSSSNPNKRSSTIAPFSSPCRESDDIAVDNCQNKKDEKKIKARSWRLHWMTCFSVKKSKPKAEGKDKDRDKSSTSVTPSPIHDSCYSAMNSYYRDENLKAVISYCRNSQGLGNKK